MTSIAFDRVFRIARLLIGTVLVSFIVFRGVLLISGWMSESGAPSVFGREVFVVRSGSMSPAIQTGDAVLVSDADELMVASLKVGDIVTFRPTSSNSLLISHRIVEALRDPQGDRLYVTKGDANESADSELVSTDRIVGRVDMRLPHVGRLLIASQGLGLMTLFAAAFLLAHVSVVLGRSARDLKRETLAIEGPPNERNAL